METYNHYMLTLIFEKPSKITYNILHVLRYIIYCDVHNFILRPKYMYSKRLYSYILNIPTTTSYYDDRLFYVYFIYVIILCVYSHSYVRFLFNRKMIRLVLEIRSSASRVLRLIKYHKQRFSKKYYNIIL